MTDLPAAPSNCQAEHSKNNQCQKKRENKRVSESWPVALPGRARQWPARTAKRQLVRKSNVPGTAPRPREWPCRDEHPANGAVSRHVRAIRTSTLGPLVFLLASITRSQRPSTCPGMFAWRRNGSISMRREISWPYEAKCPTLFPMPTRSAARERQECQEIPCVRHFATRRRDLGWNGARDPMHASPKRLARTFALHRAAEKRTPIPR
jgi:hypothetical protein